MKEGKPPRFRADTKDLTVNAFGLVTTARTSLEVVAGKSSIGNPDCPIVAVIGAVSNCLRADSALQALHTGLLFTAGAGKTTHLIALVRYNNCGGDARCRRNAAYDQRSAHSGGDANANATANRCCSGRSCGRAGSTCAGYGQTCTGHRRPTDPGRRPAAAAPGHCFDASVGNHSLGTGNRRRGGVNHADHPGFFADHGTIEIGTPQLPHLRAGIVHKHRGSAFLHNAAGLIKRVGTCPGLGQESQ